jgi:hypothetical protein
MEEPHFQDAMNILKEIYSKESLVPKTLPIILLKEFSIEVTNEEINKLYELYIKKCTLQ